MKTKKELAQLAREFKAKRIAEGGCVQCKNDAEPGKRMCLRCRTQNRDRLRKRRQALRDQGICYRCQGQAVKGEAMCGTCKDENRKLCAERLERNRKGRKCGNCNQPLEKGDNVLCAGCKEDQKVREQLRSEDRLSKGLCVKCGENPNEPGVTRCTQCKHRDNDKAYKKRYGISREQVQQMLDDQDKKCLTCDCDISQGHVVDHDHDTRAVRGLLCQSCNLRLGRYEAVKRLNLIPRFEEYIDASKQQQINLD